MKWRKKKQLYESRHPSFDLQPVEKLRELGTYLRQVRIEQTFCLKGLNALG